MPSFPPLTRLFALLTYKSRKLLALVVAPLAIPVMGLSPLHSRDQPFSAMGIRLQLTSFHQFDINTP